MISNRNHSGQTNGRVLCCATALLALSLAAQMAIGGPVTAELVRQEVAAEREAVRRLSDSVAKAIRDLVRGVQLNEQETDDATRRFARVIRTRPIPREPKRSTHQLDLRRLDLPPPARG